MKAARHHDPLEVPDAVGGYSNAVEVHGTDRMLFISGQIPQSATGEVPTAPAAQCRLIWQHITRCLSSAGMSVANLVQVRTYLSDRSLAEVNSLVRQEVLGAHRPALTVVVAQIFDPAWLLEIEAIACA